MKRLRLIGMLLFHLIIYVENFAQITDEKLHVAAGVGIGITSGTFSKKPILTTTLSGAVVGFGKEYYDWKIMGRKFDTREALLTTFSSAFVGIVFRLIKESKKPVKRLKGKEGKHLKFKIE